MLSFEATKVLTFDCYGTLIDWETGIAGAIRRVTTPRGIDLPDQDALARFARLESPIQAGPFARYRNVLDLTMTALCRELGFEPTAAERTALSDSVPQWRPFPDTVAALQRLATSFELGIVSNIDDDLFAATAPQLGVPLGWVVTAEQVGSYKPSPENFRHALARIGRPVETIVHCAQSLFHDIGPAQSMGLKTVWVDRRGGRAGGAVPPSSATADLVVPDLATLARIATVR